MEGFVIPGGIDIILGVLLPPAIQLINGRLKKNKKKTKLLIALIGSIVVGFIVALIAGKLEGIELIAGLGIVFGFSQIVYKTYWQKFFKNKVKKDAKKE